MFVCLLSDIKDGYRKRGFASALLELVERTRTSRYAATIELNVHAANASARDFYEHIGFAEAGKTSGGAVLVMRRRR